MTESETETGKVSVIAVVEIPSDEIDEETTPEEFREKCVESGTLSSVEGMAISPETYLSELEEGEWP